MKKVIMMILLVWNAGFCVLDGVWDWTFGYDYDDWHILHKVDFYENEDQVQQKNRITPTFYAGADIYIKIETSVQTDILFGDDAVDEPVHVTVTGYNGFKDARWSLGGGIITKYSDYQFRYDFVIQCRKDSNTTTKVLHLSNVNAGTIYVEISNEHGKIQKDGESSFSVIVKNKQKETSVDEDDLD